MEVTLTAEAGRTLGSASSRRLRAQGRVPAVVYGHGMDPVAFSIARRDLRAALNTEAGLNALITLQIGGDSHLAIARDIQRDAVRHEVSHVDFIVVNRNEAISIDVPIHLEGEATDVLRESGVVEQVLNALTVNTTPTNIPTGFTIDISGLQLGDTVRVSDIALPSGVTTDVDPDEAVVTAQVSRATIEAEALEAEAAEAAAEAAEEGEGGEGEDGAAEASAEGGDADASE